MKLEILNEDPFNVLSSTKFVVEGAKFVSIDEEKLAPSAERILQRFDSGLKGQELGFTILDKLEDTLQLLFIENAVNFCYWPGTGEAKWQVEWPAGKLSSGGWYGLVACFERALAEGIPILDAAYVSQISLEQGKAFFRGVGGVEIPLLKERVSILHESGQILQQNFQGQIIRLVEASEYDGIEVVNNILKHFPSFRDISRLDDKEVRLLKRVQIYANDLAYVLRGTPHAVKGLDQLTAFADYKLPQVLRMFGVLSYEPSLGERVDNLLEIPHDSREEIEIRAATIWAVELLRQRIETMSAGQIDNTLWLISQDIQDQAKPYHRTRTIFY